MFTNDWDNLGGGAHRGWITSPVLIGTADTPGNAYNLCLSGNYAFIADYGKGVQIINWNDVSGSSRLFTGSNRISGGPDTPVFVYSNSFSNS